MDSSNNADATLPAIICLDSSGDIWRRLRTLLESDSNSSEFILTRASEQPADVLALCRRLVPAVLLVAEAQFSHVPFAGLRGIIGPNSIHVLLFSEKTDLASLEYFFRQGCAGVLSKTVKDQTLLKAICCMLSGELWLPRKVISKVARELLFLRPGPKLTRRELDILRLIGLGNTNQEIADHCFISRETVRWHIRSLYNKMGVTDRNAAMREAKFFREVAPESSAIDD